VKKKDGLLAKSIRYAPPWAIPALGIVIAGGLFAFALSGSAYEATTLPDARILSRKIESLAAFALVSFFACASLRRTGPSAGFAAAIGAVYSAAIEVGQHLAGSHESLLWNAIDVACGAAGGAAGGWIYERSSAVAATRD
jgi:hypothetical protein